MQHSARAQISQYTHPLLAAFLHYAAQCSFSLWQNDYHFRLEILHTPRERREKKRKWRKWMNRRSMRKRKENVCNPIIYLIFVWWFFPRKQTNWRKEETRQKFSSLLLLLFFSLALTRSLIKSCKSRSLHSFFFFFFSNGRVNKMFSIGKSL